ncbi:hypothetical protein [Holdemania filiformis]|uniref:Uncharacterized protein n=1 Tax=Holdemania filiformis DSM 12042 TaxID=545696 RepID=B9YB31_9FIRM|nr:hypothetical protein HOLDEFILI_03038 [Holdemania filiformis DSM 12042]
MDVNEKRNVLIENIRFSALIHDLAANLPTESCFSPWESFGKFIF